MRSETMHGSTHKAHDINDFEGLQTDINSDKRMWLRTLTMRTRLGTSSRLEPRTLCMASRPTENVLVGLLPANRAKRELCTGRGLSHISPRFAGVLSTNCPPRCQADRAPTAPGALPRCRKQRCCIPQVER